MPPLTNNFHIYLLKNDASVIGNMGSMMVLPAVMTEVFNYLTQTMHFLTLHFKPFEKDNEKCELTGMCFFLKLLFLNNM